MNYSELLPNAEFFKCSDWADLKSGKSPTLNLFQKMDSVQYRNFITQEHVYTVDEDFEIIVVSSETG